MRYTADSLGILDNIANPIVRDIDPSEVLIITSVVVNGTRVEWNVIGTTFVLLVILILSCNKIFVSPYQGKLPSALLLS